MAKYKIPDVPHNRRVNKIEVFYKENDVPRIITTDDFIEVKTNEVSIVVQFIKDSEVAAKNRII